MSLLPRVVALPRGLVQVTFTVVNTQPDQHFVLHFIPPADQDDSSHRVLATALGDWFAAAGDYPPFLGPNRYLGTNGVVALALLRSVHVGFPFNVVQTLVELGISGGQATSRSVSGCVTKALHWDTVSPLRHAWGRTYIPGLAEEFLDPNNANKLDPGAVAGLLEAWLSLIGNFGPSTVVGLGYVPVVWLRSRQVGGPAAMPVTAPIVSCRFTNLDVDTQIRRLYGHRQRGPRESPTEAPGT